MEDKEEEKKNKKTPTLISAHNMFTVFCSYIGKQVKAK